VTLEEINALDREAFTLAFAAVAEGSPWVAYGAFDDAPFATGLELVAGFRAAIARAGDERQLDLIRAHPDLAGRVALAGELTAHSAAEQAGAGLDRLTPAQLARFEAANRTYLERFSFPFVICVRGHTADSILDAYDARIANDHEIETAIALDEVVKIIRLRVATLVEC
jgi:OHCU decarboxylase